MASENLSPSTGQAFQVDLRGVIGLLSRHIYSTPRVFVRELLQNGRDAIEARRIAEGREVADPSWGIRVIPVVKRGADFHFIDSGIGLSLSDLGEFLSTVGHSSKRDELDVRREGYLGQFGIGLLSCFMVTDTITIRSRSALGHPPVEWLGHSDGTYTARELTGRAAAAVPVGTEVIIRPRPDDAELVSQRAIVESVREYGEFLSVPVRVDVGRSTETINRRPIFLIPFDEPSDELLEYGRDLLGGVRPLDAISVSVTGTSTAGTAFVLPYAPAPGARSSDRAYLGGILISNSSQQLLPDWAFFVRCVISTESLTPTASREQFVSDDALEYTREQLGLAIRRWIVDIAATDRLRLGDFIGIHEQALKALVVFDRELARAVTPWLTFETSLGRMTAHDIAEQSETVRYTTTVDEFRQIVGISGSSLLIVNGGYVNDVDVLMSLPTVIDGVRVERIRATDELDGLAVVAESDRERAHELELRATAALAQVGVDVVVRSFAPDDLPAVYLADPELVRSIQRGSATDIATGLWGDVMSRINDHAAEGREATGAGSPARLCVNWSSQLVRTLCSLRDSVVFERTMRLLYVQALLAGHRPMSALDRRMLTESLNDLVQLSAETGLDTQQEGSGDV
jgi:molecular chaperone HtpG